MSYSKYDKSARFWAVYSVKKQLRLNSKLIILSEFDINDIEVGIAYGRLTGHCKHLRIHLAQEGFVEDNNAMLLEIRSVIEEAHNEIEVEDPKRIDELTTAYQKSSKWDMLPFIDKAVLEVTITRAYAEKSPTVLVPERLLREKLLPVIGCLIGDKTAIAKSLDRLNALGLIEVHKGSSGGRKNSTRVTLPIYSHPNLPTRRLTLAQMQDIANTPPSHLVDTGDHVVGIGVNYLPGDQGISPLHAQIHANALLFPALIEQHRSESRFAN